MAESQAHGTPFGGRYAGNCAGRLVTKGAVQFRSIPLFMVYLVLLMHNYYLDLVSPRPGSQRPRHPPTSLPTRHQRSVRGPFVAAITAAQKSCIATVVAVCRYLRALCTGCSLAPHCLLLHVQVRPASFPLPQGHFPHNSTSDIPLC